MSTNSLSRTVRVQLLHVPDCPLVERVRDTLRRSLAGSGVHAVVEELEGTYASPTLLVDGIDVTGRPAAPEGVASCRFDLPTQEQVSTALIGLRVLDCDDQCTRRLRATAFQELGGTGEPVPRLARRAP